MTVGTQLWIGLLKEYDLVHRHRRPSGQESGHPRRGQPNVLTCGDATRHRRRRDADFTGKRVVVIGGGNVAMDVTRSSIRLGRKRSPACTAAALRPTALPDEVTALWPRARRSPP